jgi:hypothetical protein
MRSKAYGIGVIGHCDLGGQEEFSYVHLCLHEILTTLRKKYHTVKAISAISEGADSIFAQSAVSMGIQLESVIPFDEFTSDFTKQETYERYKCLRNKSESEIRINFTERSGRAYRKSMEWVVFKSNVVIAVWDGEEIGSVGGTWEAVSLCKKLKKQFIHLNTSTRTMNVYFNNGTKYTFAEDIPSTNIVRYI